MPERVPSSAWWLSHMTTTRKKIPTAGDLTHKLDETRRLLDATRTKLDAAIERANCDTDEGLKPASTGPAVNTSDVPDLFARAFIRIGRGDQAQWLPKQDYIQKTVDQLTHSIDRCATLAAAAYVATIDLCAITPEAAQLFLDASDSRYCTNCGAAVVRLRAGRCDPCYMWRTRHHGEDRPRDQWA